jgi:uncharacterized membrane protein
MALAYERLSSLDQTGTRQALFDGWRNGEIISPRAFALLMASFIPTSGLKTLHAAKRGLRTAMRTRLWTRNNVETKVVRVRTAANDHRKHTRSTTDGGDAE